MVPPPRHTGLLPFDQTIQRLEQGWFTPHGDDDHFDLHSLPLNEFIGGMDACGEPGTFLDMGCGVGTKLLLAYLRGWMVTGVERHTDYAEAARRLVPEAQVIVGDAWTFTGYDAFDVVYSYRLAYELERQHELNQLIVSRMRPGSLYFCAGSDPVAGVAPVSTDVGVWRVV